MDHHNKGKPLTTSVPSFAIRFHANAEQLEPLYASDEEHGDHHNEPTTSTGKEESEGSPLRSYLPKLIKRSASIDTSPAHPPDSSPPSDPWRFFSDIKGKITKSVEEKLTEIKARNHEEGSPRKLNPVKDSKESSSLSDSEELSESSISKTCGIVSTTEGVEMSSDDDSPSLEKEITKPSTETKKDDKSSKTPENKKAENPLKPVSTGLRHRFRLLKNKTPSREGVLRKADIHDLCTINGTLNSRSSEAITDEVESGVDVLEDTEFHDVAGTSGRTADDTFKSKGSDTSVCEDILSLMSKSFDNVEVDDDNVINIKDVNGQDIRTMFLTGERPRTVFAPSGFVDLRQENGGFSYDLYIKLGGLLLFAILFYYVHLYSTFLGGIMIGFPIAAAVIIAYQRIFSSDIDITSVQPKQPVQQIFEIPAVKEYQPVVKFEGWVNEYPDVYNPHTYHISQTQSVFLRLQGNLLKVSHCRSKIPKRAMWNEPHIKPHFTYHRIYNLLGAKITLLPEGLTKKRHWSKKYPICITLSNDQLSFNYKSPVTKLGSGNGDEIDKEEGKKGGFSLNKKKPSVTLPPQRFSKLTEEEEDFNIESDKSSPRLTPDSEEQPLPDATHESNGVEKFLDEALANEDDQIEDDLCSLPDDWSVDTLDDATVQTRLFFFGRTDREKEDWFRRLANATHKGAHISLNQPPDPDLDVQESVSQTLLDANTIMTDYRKFMALYTKPRIFKRKSDKHEKETTESNNATSNFNPCDILWLNALIGRVLFDCMRDAVICQRLKERIQRKLSSIKLPYFIEELNIKELNLGTTSPFIHQASSPVVDDRGIWIDLEMSYEGLVVFILQTNLNLMKLKQPQVNSKSIEDKPLAMYNSEVDDTAESSSNDEFVPIVQNTTSAPLDPSGYPVPGLGGTSTASKKFIKMVDKIAESKFFQAATENKYIKNLMEGVSNTDLRLKVELKSLCGTMVLNIPPPPSDRVWIGFRPVPKIQLSAQPIVGERNITMLRITTWIEKKLLQEFQKLMVIPNMEDFTIPVMCPNLPE